jgi:peptidoglycan/LPS O-acetylase OafA/YrhL
MSAPSSHAADPFVAATVHDPAKDAQHHDEHQVPEKQDHATEVAHAWEHFWENARFFAGFLAIILLTVLAFNINFGRWNLLAILILAAIRSGFIAYFLAHLFKSYSIVFRTLTFTAVFLSGMIWLSLWDSTIKSGYVGDPITLPKNYHEAPVENAPNP